MASISSSDQRLSISKRRFKPLMLRDYLLDDLTSSSSNGFKSFPRRLTPSSSSTVRLLLDAEIKRSGLIHRKPRRTTCGTAISYAVRKASTAFLKLLPFPSSPGEGVFSRSFSKRLLSRSFWRKQPVSQSRREVTVVDGDGDGDGEIQWWRSAAYFPDHEESLDQPSDLISQISVVDEAIFSISPTVDQSISGGDSLSSGSELFTNSSEVIQSSSSSFSSSGESEEASNGNDAVEGGENLNARDSDGSSVNGNSLSNQKVSQLKTVTDSI